VKRVLVTGGSGFIGRRLVQELLSRGDQVTVLTRDVARARGRLPAAARVAAGEPTHAGPWYEEVGVVDAVVHLAGEVAIQRWTDETKRTIEKSRVESTRHLVDAMGQAKHKPKVLVCASAIGYYGARPPEEELDEDAEPGEDFMAQLVRRWEGEAKKAETHGIRSVQVRTGIVLGEDGGALKPMATAHRLYGGGPIGDGTQVVSWIHRDDVVGIFLLALDNEAVSGPINAVSPYPVTNRELSEAIGVVMNRPSWFRVPAGILRMRYGESADAILTGQRVVPARANEYGYEFRRARLTPALESILAKD
jgi:uncharacterized protein (TIGR01777 family)